MAQFHPQRRAGFECGATGARMVLLAHRHAACQVEHIFTEDVPFESRIKGKPRRAVETARQFLLHQPLAGTKTVFVANEAVDNCFVILPKLNKAETASAIVLQAKKLIAWDVETPVMAFAGYEFLRERVGYLVGLANWPAVKTWCRLIEDSGSIVDDITLGACAFQALAHYQKWTDEFPVVLVADVGATASSIYVLDREAVKFMRKIPVGGDAMTKVLTTGVSTQEGPVQLTELEAESVKITGSLPPAEKEPESGSGDATAFLRSGTSASPMPAGRPPGRRIEQREMLVRPVIERITSELMRSIQFFKDNAGQKVEAVFLTGGTAGMASLRSYMETTVGVPVRVIDPFAGLPFADPSLQSIAEEHKTQLAMATGLALVERPVISLLPKSMQLLKRLAAFIPRGIAALLILGFVPLLATGIYQVVKIQQLRSETKQWQQQLQWVGQQRQRLDTLQKQFQESSEYFHALQNLVGRNPLWPGILNALADALPPNIVLTRFSAGFDSAQPDTILIEGNVLPAAVGFDDATSTLLQALSGSVFFKQVNIINAKAVSSGRKAPEEPGKIEKILGTFEIQCELIH